jgi:PAS domain S-box-containing protein
MAAMPRFDFQEIVEHLPVVVYVDELDERSSPLYISPQIAKLLGYTPAEWLADPDLYVSSVHPDDRGRVLSDIAERNRRGSSLQHDDYRMLTRDGRVIWIRDDEIVVDGTAHGYLQDVTARTQSTIRLELLAYVLSLAAEELSPQELISRTADKLSESFGIDTVTVVELADGNLVTPRYTTAPSGLPLVMPMIPEAYEPLREGPVVIDDVLAERWLEAAWPVLADNGVRSAVDVPLSRNGEIVAVLWFNCAEPRRWTSEEVRALTEVAAQLGVVLERSEEREQRFLAERDLRRRDAVLEAISRTAARMLAEDEWQASAPELLRSLGEAVDASRAYVFENAVRQDGAVVTSQRFEWTAPGIAPELENEVLQELCFAEAGLGRVELLGSSDEVFAGNVAGFPEGERAFFGAQGIRSIMTVPIFASGAWWGFIGFDDCEREREWTASEVEALRLAGSLFAAAIERQRSETIFREHEHKLRAIFESALDGILVLNDERTIADANPAACELFGRARRDLVGCRIDEFLPDEETASVEASWTEARGPIPVVREYGLRRADGSLRRVEAAVRPDFLPGHHAPFVRDVTERKRLEAELLGAQKLESIGRLAGGVAHDFNNLLTAITGYTSLLLERTNGDSELTHDLGEIHRASERAARLTRQLLAFGRRQVLQPQALDLNEVLAETGSLLRRLLGEHVVLELRPSPGLGTVRVDPGQIEQVIVNLAVNARDAMPDGGRLTITTRELELDGRGLVELEVRDTGIGMDAETQAQIFEPFFTTRAAGSGLGLASVHGIVLQSDGEVSVESEPGAGSSFRVRLPRVAEPAQAQIQATPSARRTGSETILLVEDENVVRALAQRVLERCGYTVLACADGAEALRVAEGSPLHIDLLLTDVVMPGLRGHEVAERVTASRPGVKVLYMSGYADEALLGRAAIDQRALIEKPFAVDALAERVREALGA